MTTHAHAPDWSAVSSCSKCAPIFSSGEICPPLPPPSADGGRYFIYCSRPHLQSMSTTGYLTPITPLEGERLEDGEQGVSIFACTRNLFNQRCLVQKHWSRLLPKIVLKNMTNICEYRPSGRIRKVVDKVADSTLEYGFSNRDDQ